MPTWPSSRLLNSCLLVATGGGAVLGAPTPAIAQDVDVRALAELVRQQSQEIADLRKRLAAVEETKSPAVAGATAPTIVATTSPAEAAPGMGAAPVFKTEGGKVTFHTRGRLLIDFSTTGGSNVAARNYAATGARAIRIGADGTVGDHFAYLMEADLSQSTAQVLNAYVALRLDPVDRVRKEVRLGNLFADRGVEGATAVDAVPFMQRNLVADAILPRAGFYGVGIQSRISGEDWHASLAVTGDPLDGNSSRHDSWTISGRAHFDGIGDANRFFHLGAWGFAERLDPGIDSLSRNLDIGGRLNTALRVPSGALLEARSSTGFGGELGAVAGPFWLMGEAGNRQFKIRDGANSGVTAWSVAGGYTVIGGRAPYDRRSGSFIRPRIDGSVLEGGPGAIELVGRYERLDYDRLIAAGSGREITLGANWYLTQYLRLMGNFILWRIDVPGTPRDAGHTSTMRMELVF
ncbi:phosphate-selective porin OprO/OprP [Sphingobium sp. B2D3A]|uniref:OprO/OprP family phosphate-selective porin n=1 Tax=unclassified Sphingobium TaxID=2611147 RepID=UPI002225625E|nr:MULTISPECIES: OprO/OprP family phosphate-selective porin [unclassified Sphingobium]MCW2338245.1 phosphate-selective porin OprO/OprP [Sphingobium sp. B2D3A]MCW2384703.1 phosphate-selective porin OprO/OprP [Sphingobium sp. B2D3D]